MTDLSLPSLSPPLDRHDHDRGLAHDLDLMEQLRLERRRALAWIGGGLGTALLGGCGGGDSPSSASSTATVGTTTTTSTTTTTTTTTTDTSGSTGSTTTASGTCTVPATETNGPYPADGTNTAPGLTSNVLTQSGVVRSDIRSSFVGSSTTTAAGVQVDLTLTLVDANNSCSPLVGYAVYIWHCDAAGKYSLYNLTNESYLRGVQVTDANGQVKFTTIFPGCYSGRYPHIHFEVYSSLTNATSGKYAVLISQLAMPSAQCSAVYATSAYSSSTTNFKSVSIASDNIFGDDSSAQLAVMTPSMSGSVSAGYTASTTIAIAT